MTREYRPCQGQIIAVRGVPGPESGIEIDVRIDTHNGPEYYRGVHPSYLPTDFDVSIMSGAPASVAWISETHGVWSCPWVPMTDEC